MRNRKIVAGLVAIVVMFFLFRSCTDNNDNVSPEGSGTATPTAYPQESPEPTVVDNSRTAGEQTGEILKDHYENAKDFGTGLIEGFKKNKTNQIVVDPTSQQTFDFNLKENEKVDFVILSDKEGLLTIAGKNSPLKDFFYKAGESHYELSFATPGDYYALSQGRAISRFHVK